MSAPANLHTIRCAASLLAKDLNSQVAIVTGANQGCGLETSRQLAKQGATVVLACRNPSLGKQAAEEVGGTFLQLDLSSYTSVRKFVAEFEAKFDRLDILVNNAGVICPPQSTTHDGHDMQVQVNHLSHFLLLELLMPLMIKTVTTTGRKGRVVALASCGAAECGFGFPSGMPQLDMDDLDCAKKRYNVFLEYQRSKLANYLHMLEAPKRHPNGVVFASVHPGWVVKSNPGGFKVLPKDGCQSTLHAVLEKEENMINGGFYSQTGVYKDSNAVYGGFPLELPNPYATPENAAKLWDASVKMVGL